MPRSPSCGSCNSLAHRPALRATSLRLIALALLGTLLIFASAGFVLLFLGVPEGWSPGPGWAPLIGQVYLRAFPYPHRALTPEAYTRASATLVLSAWALWGAAMVLLARTKDAGERARALSVV